MGAGVSGNRDRVVWRPRFNTMIPRLLIIGPGNWMLYFDFNDTGYVKDDEKDKLDADELMKALRESQTRFESQKRYRTPTVTNGVVSSAFNR